jgi:oligoendopeptidase F
VDDYLKFLKSGGTDYPIEELKIAGVDMSSPVPIENALKLFKELVDELENLSNE